MHFRIRNGLDVPVDGAPAGTIDLGHAVGSVALLGADYVGLEPRMLVQVGDRVAPGTPLLQHKRDPDVVFTAPGGGTVTAVNRGARRVLKSVVIELDDQAREYPFELSDVAATGVRQALLASGLWSAFRTRPFSRVPGSAAVPRSIFVTAIDTQPLAADPALVVSEFSAAFERGLAGLTELGDVPVYLCTAPGWQGPDGGFCGIRHATFEGPHPAGLPGTHIHHLDPVGASRSVWHIGYQDVIAIGKLLGEGVLWAERVVALGGNGLRAPRLVRTRLGACLETLLSGEFLAPDGAHDAPRVVSGSPLSGRLAAGSEAYLGRYHLQVAAIRQPHPGKRWRLRRLFDRRFSFAGTFARATGQRPPAPFDTDQNGRATALVPIDAFERLLPLEMLAQPLLRALLIKDTDQAQALGALELDEEDLALCSFVCPGKNDYAAVLRANLEQIVREG